MSDPVVALAGDPSAWPATVRDLVRTASEGGLDRATAISELTDTDTDTSDAAPAERRLAFLEAADLLACEAGTCRPGVAGREYLQTHDAAVLFGALADAANGFEGLVEALAVRPLTDIEAADLLGTDRDCDVDPTVADRYLAWLEALGYITREDGVNDLTRSGRRLIATTDHLTPPGDDTTTPADGDTDPEPDSPAATQPATGQRDGTQPDAGTGGEQQSRDAAPRTDHPASDHPTADDVTTSLDAATTQSETTPASSESGAEEATVVVDADLERALRDRYDDTCMVCGERRQRGPQAGYAEVHFLMPRRDPHDGPASAANALVVCPNHRADLEHGTVTIDPQSLTVAHSYDEAVDGRTLRTVDDHDVGAQYLAYHNDVIADP